MRNPDWQRVSPLALIYFALDLGRKIVDQGVNLLPLLVGIWAGGELVRHYAWHYGLPLALGGIVLAVVLRYWFFRYRVDGDRIHLRSGVFKRKRLTLEFERVQQADVALPFYFRPFGLASLGLESAGSGRQEVNIAGIPRRRAEDLRRRILARGEEPAAGSAGAGAGDYRLTLPLSEVLRYGLMHNGLLFLLPAVGPLSRYLETSLDWVAARYLAPLLGTAGDTFWVSALLLVGLVLGLVMLLFGLSIVAGLVRFHRYRLVRRGDGFQYRSGLGTIKSRSFRRYKLQQVTVTQGLMARLLKRFSLSVSKAGDHTAAPAKAQQQKFLVPVLTDRTLAAMSEQLQLPGPQWRSVSGVYVLRNTLVWGSWLTLLAGVLLLAAEAMLWPALLVFPAVALVSLRCWRCLAYHRGDGWLALRTGFVGRKVQWMPEAKVQKVAFSRPPWLRSLGLCHLTVWGAAGKLAIPFLAEGEGARLSESLLESVAGYRGRWF